MINWFIFVFYLITSTNILSFQQIVLINFPLILGCRTFLALMFYFRYKSLFSNEEGNFKVFFTNNYTIYYILKQILIVLLSMVYFPITLLVSLYSLLVASDHLQRFANIKRMQFFSVAGKLLRFLAPLIAILYYFLLQGVIELAIIAFVILLYFLLSPKRVSRSIDDLKNKFTNSRFNKTIIMKSLHVIIFIFGISASFFVITSVSIFSPPIRNTYNIEMGDGVKLATDVYFSPGSYGAPKPVILVRTPYGKTGWAFDLYSIFYFTQDYHIVIQDLRGTGDSGGGNNFLLFTKSYQDGVDTIAWLMNQPWCNGRIASVGVSALCINQYFAAGMNPDGLLSQSLWFGTPELFDHAIYQGSYHKSSVENWIESTAPENYDFQIETIFDYFPKNETMYNSTSLRIPIGPTYSNISVSALHVGGWYDHFLQGTLDGYVGYDDYGSSVAKGHQKLIMGPWTHGNIYGGKQGQLTYPKNSDGFNLILDWEQEIFDETLLGIPATWDEARVAYYVMGDVDVDSADWNYWRYAYDWPLDHINNTWYLTSTGGLINGTNPSPNFNYSYLFDPRDPVPTLGGQNQPFDLNGPYDQRSLENRSDVLIFESDTLIESFETVGRIWGHLFVTSNCTDTDFTVKLTDVYPDGRSMLITDGSLTVRSRNSYASEDFMTGNTQDIYELWVDCWSTAYTFAPGHKIRVAISSSNYPRYAINPNTGAPLAENYLNYNIANNTILTGANLSSIIMPSLVNMESTHTFY